MFINIRLVICQKYPIKSISSPVYILIAILRLMSGISISNCLAINTKIMNTITVIYNNIYFILFIE